MRIADVYINLPIKSIAQAFSYILPAHLDKVNAGWRVLVPFGGRDIEGFVVDVCSELEYSKRAKYPLAKLKEVKSAVDEEPWFNEAVLEASQWLAKFYLCSPGEIMRLFMPGKSGLKIQLQYEAVEAGPDNMLLMVDVYRQVYEALQQHGVMTPKALAAKLREAEQTEAEAQLDRVLEGLLRHGLVNRVYQASHRAKENTASYLVLPVPMTEAMVQSLDKRKKGQAALAQWLYQDGKEAYATADLQKQGFSLAVIKGLCASGLAQLEQRRVLRDSYGHFASGGTVESLTDEQQQAVTELSKALEKKSYQPYLLYGITGSGKTQVYIEIVKQVRQQKRIAMVLVPEIALTGQVVQAFKAYFGQDIVVLHSRLSINERNDAILRIRTGEAGIVIGARSALFVPADNVGIIIMDEEQDNSYKQDESPRYHARVVAHKLAQLHGAVLLLGSATPSLETYYHAIKGEYGLLRLTKRIGNMPLPRIQCADMRQELKMGRRSVISQPLQQLILDTLAKKEQLILMLNRRGFSTFVMCRSCGETIKCPQCTMPLVYHRDGRLLCHHCDIQMSVPDICPKCGSHYIKYFGSGTEKLEQELSQLVPQARIIRMDRDTTGSKFAHTEILAKFRKGEYDILLGTQMVAKGHDIPNVTGVGILSADSTLNMPDFRAAERVFMLITQTAGRAGRGEIPGRVVVQCYNPEHFAVQTGMAQNYGEFFKQEMKLRQTLFNPPYSRLIKLIFQSPQEQEARQMAMNLLDAYETAFGGSALYQAAGPAPAMMSCLRGIYRYVLLLKTRDIWGVLDFLRQQGIAGNMQVAVDIDPLTTS